jgi:hypothetical protein
MGVLSLIAKLGIDTSGFRAGLKQSQSAADKFGKNVGGSLKGQLAAAFGVAAMVQGTKRLVDYSTKIDDLSIRLGVSKKALQEFDYAAQQSSGGLDDVVNSMQKLATSRADALKNPTGDMAQSFRDLGISVEQLKSARLEDLLKSVGEGFKSAATPQEKMASGLRVLGETGAKLIPAMISGLDEMADSAHKAGVIISDDASKNLREFGDILTTTTFKARALASELASMTLTAAGWTTELIGAEMDGVGAFWGAVSAGASSGEAAEAMNSAMESVIMKNIRARDARRAAAANQGRVNTAGVDFSNDAAGASTTAKGHGLGFTANSLQQIGAFVGQNPILFEARTQTATQKKMALSLSKIEGHLRTSGGGFLG